MLTLLLNKNTPEGEPRKYNIVDIHPEGAHRVYTTPRDSDVYYYPETQEIGTQNFRIKYDQIRETHTHPIILERACQSFRHIYNSQN